MLCYSAGVVKLLQAFRDSSPVARVQIMVFINVIVVTISLKQIGYMTLMAKVNKCLQSKLQMDRVELNRAKYHVLLPGRAGPESLVAE